MASHGPDGSIPSLAARPLTSQATSVSWERWATKPVRVFEIPILNHTTAQDAVYDPFVGSGTALIAGEKLGRPTYAMDVDPIYVEVARRRWEAFTGQTAVRLTPERAPTRRRRRAR